MLNSLLHAVLAIAALVGAAMFVGAGASAFGHATGLLPAHPTPVIRIVHTNTGCQL